MNTNIHRSGLAVAGAILVAVLGLLLSTSALALGGDPNLLLKKKALPAGQGYVLFSMAYSKADMAPFETPCIGVDIVPVAAADAGKKKPKAQYLTTTTGLHCNTAWKDEKVVIQEQPGGGVRVVILYVVPAGEYEVGETSVQYSVGLSVSKGNPDVVGFGRLQVNAGQLAYAGTFRLLLGAGRGLLSAEDHWTQDEEVLRRLRPDLASVEVTKATWKAPATP